MSNPRSTPLEAVPLAENKPRRSWVPFIMGGMLLASGILAVVLFFWGLFRLAEQNRPGAITFSGSAASWPTRDQKQAEYRAIYKVPADVSVDSDLPQVEKLLAKYVTAVQQGDQGGLARLVDVNAFLQRMQDHPDMPRLDATARKALVVHVNQNLQLPADILDIRLMGFQRLSQNGLGVADVIFKQKKKGAYEPCRIWLKQNERSWSVVDWEFIQMGKSEAGDWAGAWRASRDYMRSTEHGAFLGDLRRAEECYRQGDIQGAIGFVQTADQRSLPDYVHRESKLHVAWLYFHCRQFQPAIDCLRTIGDGDEAPGVYVIRALCYQPLGQGEQAIAAAAEYERLCGFSPDVVLAKALALAQLKRNEEAAAQFQRLLEFDPAHESAREQHAKLKGNAP